jgi:hypothetical protein
MDRHTYDNWKKVKEVMESSGNTNNNFYRRACEIMRSGNDPLAKFLNSLDTDTPHQ